MWLCPARGACSSDALVVSLSLGRRSGTSDTSAESLESGTRACPSSCSLVACHSSTRNAIDGSYPAELSMRAEFHIGHAVPSLPGCRRRRADA